MSGNKVNPWAALADATIIYSGVHMGNKEHLDDDPQKPRKWTCLNPGCDEHREGIDYPSNSGCKHAKDGKHVWAG